MHQGQGRASCPGRPRRRDTAGGRKRPDPPVFAASPIVARSDENAASVGDPFLRS
ncbi:MAG: hypothetical protein AVDCRST_MAG59-750 [uncultured Thermomicrobiales bacterium]|uniref:Uncharacterized protein n=1 Tax=uncultured Thermomicrobiales bacterium TaxID=1645740 RepID=A0A6J4U3G3_9BACT|nr:MAG: hypothetical protein AVDCRST_MAG59-750 [uncultured Thermomicrobiales bacterium]